MRNEHDIKAFGLVCYKIGTCTFHEMKKFISWEEYFQVFVSKFPYETLPNNWFKLYILIVKHQLQYRNYKRIQTIKLAIGWNVINLKNAIIPSCTDSNMSRNSTILNKHLKSPLPLEFEPSTFASKQGLSKRLGARVQCWDFLFQNHRFTNHVHLLVNNLYRFGNRIHPFIQFSKPNLTPCNSISQVLVWIATDIEVTINTISSSFNTCTKCTLSFIHLE